jgi:hypothetical protein
MKEEEDEEKEWKQSLIAFNNYIVVLVLPELV